jgi:hypothetical protein
VEVIHDTPFNAALQDVLDCDGFIARVAVLKATFELVGDGRVVVASDQDPVHQMDQWLGEPGESSAIFESDFAYFKPASDIVFVGSVHAPRPTTSIPVSIAVGRLRKQAVVYGDRCWDYSSVFGIQQSPTRPVTDVPICWERSFGGSDRSDGDPQKRQMEWRNPIGTGFHVGGSLAALDGVPLPNFENPGEPINSWNSRPVPCGFGFIGRGWMPRVTYAGTYDDRWKKTRMPIAPRDFDYRFFNGAPPDQVYPGYLQGGELVRTVNLSPAGEDAFQIPALRVRFSGLSSGKAVDVDGVLDTAVFAVDRRRFSLTWRAKYRVPIDERSETVEARVDRIREKE